MYILCAFSVVVGGKSWLDEHIIQLAVKSRDSNLRGLSIWTAFPHILTFWTSGVTWIYRWGWCDISNLPPPLNNCWGFFRELLKEKVIVTPGVFFFDVNPGSRRKFNSYDSFIRISYGPSFKEVQRGLEGMQRVIERQKKLQSIPDDAMGSPWAATIALSNVSIMYLNS